MDQPAIVIERIFKAPAAKIWKALTDKTEMKKWYFDLSEFKAELGFKFQFVGGPPDGIQYLHLCEITEVIPNKKLSYSWRYDGYTGISYVSFELIELGENTKLILKHSGLESFPKENPDLAKHNFEEGWNHIINVSLKGYIEK
jgi:uncharacterized protein YndB with AHSA1/START domain